MIAWIRQGWTISTVREMWALFLAAGALFLTITETATPQDGGGRGIAVILAVGAFGFIVAPYWPLARVVKPSTPREHVLALVEARAALCALRETAYDHWALVSTRHVKGHTFRENTTGIVLYEPGHGIVGLAVGASVVMLKSPVGLPAGLEPPRPVSYPHVEDVRNLRTLLKGSS